MPEPSATMDVLIVADDLSGAADCAVAFQCGDRQRPGDALVLLHDAQPVAGAAIVAIDADTRQGDAVQAAAQTRHLFKRHAASGMTLFKKLDSTLRGHIGVEIAAALEGIAAMQPLAIVAPAFPATGRTTRGGRQYLHGVAVEQTETWQGLEGRADLCDLLSRAGLKTRLAAPDFVADGCDALICDAVQETDLAAIVAKGKKLGRTILWVGSGGLARHLAGPVMPPKTLLPPVTGPLLFAVGSRSQVSHAQAAQSGMVCTIVTPGMAVSWPDDTEDLAAVLDPSAAGAPQALCEAFAAAIAPRAARAAALFLTGGETARSLLSLLGVHGLRLIGELEPGVTLSQALGGVINGRPVITKAGAFGTAGTMNHCRNILRGRSEG